jgi:exonuclease III
MRKYNLDLLAVQEVKCEDVTQPTDHYIYYIIFYGNGNANHHLGIGFSVHKEII